MWTSLSDAIKTLKDNTPPIKALVHQAKNDFHYHMRGGPKNTDKWLFELIVANNSPHFTDNLAFITKKYGQVTRFPCYTPTCNPKKP